MKFGVTLKEARYDEWKDSCPSLPCIPSSIPAPITDLIPFPPPLSLLDLLSPPPRLEPDADVDYSGLKKFIKQRQARKQWDDTDEQAFVNELDKELKKVADFQVNKVRPRPPFRPGRSVQLAGSDGEEGSGWREGARDGDKPGPVGSAARAIPAQRNMLNEASQRRSRRTNASSHVRGAQGSCVSVGLAPTKGATQGGGSTPETIAHRGASSDQSVALTLSLLSSPRADL